MKIDLETIETLQHYVIHDGIAVRVQNRELAAKNISHETDLEDHAISQTESVITDEQKRRQCYS